MSNSSPNPPSAAGRPTAGLPRFFVDPQSLVHPGNRCVLGRSEGRHLTRVLRMKPGDTVALFDGQGNEAIAIIDRIESDQVQLRVERVEAIDRESAIQLMIAAALPKGDRQRLMIEKLTELGTAKFIPLLTDRAVVSPHSKQWAKFDRYVIEASKQCGRNRLMRIGRPCAWPELIPAIADRNRRISAQHESASDAPATQWKFILDPTGIPWVRLAGDFPLATSENTIRDWLQSPRGELTIVVAVGPEGGFSPLELEFATEHGFQPISLGPRILRTETAAIAIASLLTVFG